jgi:hypothetical protein
MPSRWALRIALTVSVMWCYRHGRRRGAVVLLQVGTARDGSVDFLSIQGVEESLVSGAEPGLTLPPEFNIGVVDPGLEEIGMGVLAVGTEIPSWRLTGWVFHRSGSRRRACGGYVAELLISAVGDHNRMRFLKGAKRLHFFQR